MPGSTKVFACESLMVNVRDALSLEGLNGVEVVPFRSDADAAGAGPKDLRATLRTMVNDDEAVLVLASESDLQGLGEVPDWYARVSLGSCAEAMGVEALRPMVRRGVSEARSLLEVGRARQEAVNQARMRSNYALAFDLLERISQGTEEEPVTGAIIDALNMLFSPSEIEYYALHPSGEAELFDYELGSFARMNGGMAPSLLQGANDWDEALSGFKLKVENKGRVLGVAVLKDLSFPEFRSEYLNLASQLSTVFGLAVANARAFRSLRSSEAQVERALALESTMLSISQRFFGRADLDVTISEALAQVGEAVGCSRALLLQYSPGLTSLSCSHEWVAIGTSSIRSLLATVPKDLQEWLMERAQHEGTVRSLNLSSMGPEDMERLSLLFQGGISSMLLAPILVEGRHEGWAFMQRTGARTTYEDDEVGMLRFLAQNISLALQRRKSQEDMAKLAESVTMSNKVLRHDIRNELMVLSGSLQLYDMKKEEKQLDRAKRSAARLTDILDHFKELDSFLQSSRALFGVDLRQAIVQAMGAQQLRYEVQGDAGVQADFALGSVIENLVRNSKRHGDAKNMTFAITKEKGQVLLTVSDDGKGIPEEARPKLFQEGFSYGKERGTGLGLFWVRKTMERYGGWVSFVESKEGTTFVLGFPSA